MDKNSASENIQEEELSVADIIESIFDEIKYLFNQFGEIIESIENMFHLVKDLINQIIDAFKHRKEEPAAA